MEKIMRIGDLVTALQGCNPEGTVSINLNGALLYAEEQRGEIEYSFEPTINFLFSKSDASQSDRVHISLAEKDTQRIAASRRNQAPADMQTLQASHSANPAIAMGTPIAVAIGLAAGMYADLLAVVNRCNRADNKNHGATTHGKLDVPKLIAMLAEDAAMTHSRPGSWEGANLLRVLDSHGYQ
ncbi:hypothetical protein [uncultured Massilia sp.]|uniref:hypothetical protein n=1 Tax=uncultured Massilia sp. TaxID=169973 RepID=UPI0025F96FE1|nr:hypothetical protein [uncultured Massilia sp.]